MFRFLQRRARGNVPFRQRRHDERLAVEVPMSRRELAARRRAGAILLLKWGAVAAVVAGTLSHAHGVWDRAVCSNPAFTVGEFEFQSNGGVTWQLAAATTGLRSDMNLMAVDLGELHRKLMALPRVRSVNVERRLPDRLVISMEERLPVAWLTCEALGLRQTRGGVFLDRDGVVFRCEELLREYMSLPVIAAAELPGVTFGRKLDVPAIQCALTLLREVPARQWPVPTILSSLFLPNEWTVTAETELGAVYTFATDGMERQLARLDTILKTVTARNLVVARANLQLERNIPVELVEPVAPGDEAAPPSAPPVSARPAPPAKPDDRSRRDQQLILRGA